MDSFGTTSTTASLRPSNPPEEPRCDHPSFEAKVNINREVDNSWPTVKFQAALTVKCALCGASFSFRDLPYSSGDRDGKSPDGITAILNIIPVR